MKRNEIQAQIESIDREVTNLREERAALPKNDDSLAARRLDSEIEAGLGRIAELNDEESFAVWDWRRKHGYTDDRSMPNDPN